LCTVHSAKVTPVVWAKGDIWQLLRGAEVLGEIVIDDGDFPWLYGTLHPRPAFEQVRSLFDEEWALAEADDDVEAWERAYDRIRESLELVAPHGPVSDYLLHVQGAEAWFRWID
jgi:hypothetical protein